MNRKRAFTLIELLVVIAIIALLMSILMPALSKVRKQALAVTCLARLKQWGVIISMYAGENDGYMHSRNIGTIPGYAKMWPYVYKKMYMDPKMRFCPTADNVTKTTGCFGTWNYGTGQYHPLMDPVLHMPGESEFDPRSNQVQEGYFTGSYGMNRYAENMTGGTTGTSPAFWRKVDVKGGDKAPVMMDCMYLYCMVGADDEPPAYNGDWVGNEMKWICIDRHLGYCNVVFLDSSARKVGLKELWTLMHSRTYDVCGSWTICGNGGGQEGKNACKTLFDEFAPWMSKMPVY
jgi:prepilin-type N-terminal cleavage/methylation domain-containing protein/prepilin-type processing-associated H-X9-DG protein